MYLGFSGLGYSILTSAISPPQTYSSVKIYGESHLDNISLLKQIPTFQSHINIDENGEIVFSDSIAEGNASLVFIDGEMVVSQDSTTNALTGLEINLVDGELVVTVPDDYELEKEQEWITDADNIQMLLANFEDSLEAGNVSGELPLTHWRILRRKHNTTQYTQLDIIPNNNAVKYYDFNTRSNQNYDYCLQAMSNEIYGTLIKSINIPEWEDGVMLQFYGWKLSSEDGLTTFSFDAEINTGDIKSVRKITQIDNYSQFPIINQGKQKYDVIPISCVPYDYIDNTFTVNNAILEPIKTFMEDGKIKILRNGSSRAWKVFITDFSYKYMDNVSNNDMSQPFSISFTATQVGEVIE